MSIVLRRLVPCCLVVLLAAGASLADKPKPTAPKAPAKPAAAKPAASLDEIATSFDEKEEAAHKALRQERYDAIETYVKANGSAKDLEAARKNLVDLAEELEDWTKTLA